MLLYSITTHTSEGNKETGISYGNYTFTPLTTLPSFSLSEIFRIDHEGTCW
jgi:hypothetical protein